jgi:hypothetical protein
MGIDNTEQPSVLLAKDFDYIIVNPLNYAPLRSWDENTTSCYMTPPVKATLYTPPEVIYDFPIQLKFPFMSSNNPEDFITVE